MLRSNIRQISLIIILSLIQVLVNNSTTFYFDCLSVILVILLFSKQFSLRSIILLSLFADLMGHWYLGSHIFAAILLSFVTQKLVKLYDLSGKVQKCFLISIFYTLLSSIIILIGMLTHNTFINWLNLAIEVFILCPIILWLYNLTRFRSPSSDIIF